VVEEVRTSGKLLPKSQLYLYHCHSKLDHPSSFVEFRPIALCNCIYKIIVKIIAVRINPFLSNFISPEQFGFLKGHLIHEAIGSSQEGLHTIKTQKRVVSVLKIDLSKAYDRVSWLYLQLLLLQIGFGWIW
jgi:hypothetical protein